MEERYSHDLKPPLTLPGFRPLISVPLPLRFGSRCARIFRLLLRKKHLEQKQVEDFAMIPAKEAKDMLYKMLSENFVSLQVSASPSHRSREGGQRAGAGGCDGRRSL